MPMKLKNYYKKQLILIFVPFNLLIFLDTQLHEPKISENTISEFFGNGVLVFSGEILNIQRSSVHKRYTKFRLNGSEGFNKIFGVGILENLLAAKSERNCIKFVVSHFLKVKGNIIANYR